MQRSSLSCLLAHGAVELELQDVREEVARVRSVCRDVILGAWIEISLRAGHRRGYALILLAQLPPAFVVVRWSDLAIEHLPAPLVDHQSEGQERHFLQRFVQQ